MFNLPKGKLKVLEGEIFDLWSSFYPLRHQLISFFRVNGIDTLLREIEFGF